MKIKLNKKAVKNLSDKQVIGQQATPAINGGGGPQQELATWHRGWISCIECPILV
ncbi:hypothetical protein PRUB_a4122 [Pseudoalteromonas rubra]|uniref:Uncharacterized protein n=1 Tax=Pseudoalteromonas rubra TaxID=43658 RepID=A0A8T0C4A0_9GAMM|nr:MULTISPECIES: hypothetical protein [Pseudoalteromonas]KAF7785463.1 hypothetical protein PRUB_a4122 [Pseudoalteromonas rubra]MDK1313896.1 hypothetical protein [Pseudoalteromonas sp. R96]